MIVLGLGSNVGDKLANLRKAILEIKKMLNVKKISPVYMSDALLPENAPPKWDQPYFNLALLCDTSFTPSALLQQLKTIEWSIGRKPLVRHWGPRIIDIDILAWEDLLINTDALTVPHDSLQHRPFALWPLSDLTPFWKFPLSGPNHGKTAAQMVEKWGSRFSGDAPFKTRQLNQRIHAPQLVGILNITPNSFSDGDPLLTPEKAKDKAQALLEAGAEIIDIGAESTAPKAKLIDEETEWQRLEPVLTHLHRLKKDFYIPFKLSLDTHHAAIVKKALDYGIDWINDVTGFDNKAMQHIAAASQKECVMMHHLTIPADKNICLPQDENAIEIIYTWAKKKIAVLEKSGISPEKIILDIGIGFGKTKEQSLTLLQAIDAFKDLNTRLLIGHSRKRFLSLLSPHNAGDNDIETLAISLYLASKNITYLRVHNVDMCTRALKVMDAMS